MMVHVQAQNRYGVAVLVLRETDSGDLDMQHLAELLEARDDQGFTLVSISHIPTSSGRVYDAAAVGEAVSRHPGVLGHPR